MVIVITLDLKLSLTWMIWQSITLLPSDWTNEKNSCLSEATESESRDFLEQRCAAT